MIPALIELLESRLRSSYKFADNWIELETTYTEQIITALRIARAMREAIIIANITGTPVQINALAAAAAKAWDAATKEDV